MELDDKIHSPIINDDEASRHHHVCSSLISHQPPDPHHDLCERIWEGAITEAEADELSWLQRDEECNFDFLEGISLINVGSNDFPVPEFTMQAIAQKWHDKIEHDEKWLKYDDNKHEKSGDKLGNGEFNEQKVDEQAITADKEKSPVTVDSSSELNGSKEISPAPSTDSCDNLIQPKHANLTFTKLDSSAKELSNRPNNANSTFTYSNKDSDTSCGTTSDEAFDIPKSNIPQLQIPSTKNNSSETMACGEVMVIRECCNKTIELEPPTSAQSITHGGATDKSTSKVAIQPGAPVMKKKAPVAPSNIKPMFPARKLPVKNNATAVKVLTISNNTLQSNQSHLPKQETKLKQNIKKSLLSKPIIVSKTTAKTENAGSMGPCKPAALNRPVNKVNTKSHPVKLVTVPHHHSTPIKDQAAYRRKSIATTPPRDSSEAADKKVVKQKRRSGIPLLGGMTQDVKVPMGPCNKSAEHEPNGALGMSPVVVGRRTFQPAKSTRQYGIPKPKAQLNFNTSFDPLEGLDLDGPPPGGSKLVHSPAEKENNRNTVHSQWSPIKRNKGITADEECIRCTKHTAKHF